MLFLILCCLSCTKPLSSNQKSGKGKDMIAASAAISEVSSKDDIKPKRLEEIKKALNQVDDEQGAISNLVEEIKELIVEEDYEDEIFIKELEEATNLQNYIKNQVDEIFKDYYFIEEYEGYLNRLNEEIVKIKDMQASEMKENSLKNKDQENNRIHLLIREIMNLIRSKFNNLQKALEKKDEIVDKLHKMLSHLKDQAPDSEEELLSGIKTTKLKKKKKSNKKEKDIYSFDTLWENIDRKIVIFTKRRAENMSLLNLLDIEIKKRDEKIGLAENADDSDQSLTRISTEVLVSLVKSKEEISKLDEIGQNQSEEMRGDHSKILERKKSIESLNEISKGSQLSQKMLDNLNKEISGLMSKIEDQFSQFENTLIKMEEISSNISNQLRNLKDGAKVDRILREEFKNRIESGQNLERAKDRHIPPSQGSSSETHIKSSGINLEKAFAIENLSFEQMKEELETTDDIYLVERIIANLEKNDLYRDEFNDLKEKGASFNRSEDIRKRLIHLGFKIDKALVLSAIARDQITLLKLIENKISEEYFNRMDFKENEIKEAVSKGSKDTLKILERLSTVFKLEIQEHLRRIKEEAKKLEVKEKESKEKTKIELKVFLFNEKIRKDLNMAFAASLDLLKNFEELVSMDGRLPDSKKMEGVSNIFELRGLGRNGRNQRIIFKYIDEGIVILCVFYKGGDEIPKPVIRKIKKRGGEVKGNSYSSFIQYFFDKQEFDNIKEEKESEESEIVSELESEESEIVSDSESEESDDEDDGQAVGTS